MKKYIILVIFIIFLMSGYIDCPIYNLIGVPCPFCGMTRAWKLVFSGNFGKAFVMHPLFLLPLCIFIPKLHNKKAVLWISALVLLVYIIRMIILFPNTPPMTYNYSSVIGVFLK